MAGPFKFKPTQRITDEGDPLPYSFGRSGQMSNDQIRAIALVNDGIARKLTNTMGAWLRSQVQIGLASTEPMPFSEYLRLMPDHLYTCVLRLEPLGGLALLEIELPLVLAMINVLLGGNGGAEGLREVTDIEEAILNSVLSVILRELNAAWEGVGLRFTIERREAIANVARMLPPGERTLRVTFLAQLQDVRGTFSLGLPAIVLNTIHRRLVAVSDQPQRTFEGGSQRVMELVSDVRLPAVLRLPAVRVPSHAISALEPGAVLELQLPRHTQAELQVGGIRVASAIPVGRGEHRAVLVQAAQERSQAVAGQPEESEQKRLAVEASGGAA